MTEKNLCLYLSARADLIEAIVPTIAEPLGFFSQSAFGSSRVLPKEAKRRWYVDDDVRFRKVGAPAVDRGARKVIVLNGIQGPGKC